MTRRRPTRHGGNRTAGFSTVGTLASLVLAGAVLGQLLGMVVNSQRGLIKSNARVDAARSARHGYMALTRVLRIAGNDPLGLSFQAIDPDPRGHGAFDNVRIKADYDPPDGDIDDPGEDLSFWLANDTLFVQLGPSASPEPYLWDVDSLAFEYFDRDDIAITQADQVPSRAFSVQVTIRGRGKAYSEYHSQLLTGRVTLRNGG